ncbi:MAG: outer membrane beta-barrel protein [Bacteroidales bacterium]|nr:outer membrane beta-barrel protein [Bacteroidales bacterium]
MLEETEIQEFDLNVRAILQDAEEEVPQGVWLGVYSRIAAGSAAGAGAGGKAGASGRSAGAGLWRRTAYALAAAAAVAVGVFFAATSDKSGKFDEGQAVAVVNPVEESESERRAVAVASPVEESESERSAVVAEASPAKVKVAKIKVAEAPVLTEVSEVTEGAGTGAGKLAGDSARTGNSAQDRAERENARTGNSVQDSAEHENARTGNSAQDRAERENARGGGNEKAGNKGLSSTKTDPFAEIEREDAALKLSKKKSSKGKPSLYAQSTIGGNDSDFSFTTITPNRTNSFKEPVITKTGISEKSVSTYGIPLSFGLGVNIPVSEKLTIGTGLNFSSLVRTFNGVYTEVDANQNIVRTLDSDVTHTLNYIGLPLNLYFHLIDVRTVKFYLWGGALGEYALSNSYRVKDASEDILFSTSVKGIQLSAGIGLGVEFRLSNHLGLYLDPSARYYLPCNQPKNIHTDRPFMLSFEAGLRFNL